MTSRERLLKVSIMITEARSVLLFEQATDWPDLQEESTKVEHDLAAMEAYLQKRGLA